MSAPGKQIVVTGGFDDIRSRHLRFLQEAAKLGELTVLLWPDKALEQQTGQPPKFPLPERLYFLQAVRGVSRVIPIVGRLNTEELPETPGISPNIWADEEGCINEARQAYCRRHGLEYRVLGVEQLQGFPAPEPEPAVTGQKKVLVTGSYDWLHSGHLRFFEEASACGELYVVVGHDANIRLLKGQGHPLLPQEERRYMVGAIKYVKQALISTGDGWLDADPEIQMLRPDLYIVNEDGDRGGKREYCQKLGLQYLVFDRKPAPSLERRSSTTLRGF